MALKPDFLGTGWQFPPEFGVGGATVALVSGEEDIQQSLQILLTTRLAERVMQPDFGCDLTDLVFEDVDQAFITRLRSYINDAILYHEPRITLNRVSVDDRSAQDGMVLIAIDYTIRSTNSRFNMVFPFYKEAGIMLSG